MIESEISWAGGRKQKVEEIKKKQIKKKKNGKRRALTTIKNTWNLAHSLILFSVGPNIFTASLKCSIIDKGGKNMSLDIQGKWGYFLKSISGFFHSSNLSLFLWFQLSLIAENLVFNTNQISPYIPSCCFPSYNFIV